MVSPSEAGKRYLSLKTHRIRSLPVLMLEPHSACNCRCLMCDIWKGNPSPRQLQPADLERLIEPIKQFKVRRLVLTGGEALLHPLFFELCALLRRRTRVRLTVLSTGLLLEAKAQGLIDHCDEVIVSLDGSERVHDAIRRVPHAFRKLREGVAALKGLAPNFPVTGRCVIQRENFRDWPRIVDAARDIKLDRISFLAADVTTTAFNRPQPWEPVRQGEVALDPEQLPVLRDVILRLVASHAADFNSGFIAESADKIRRIYDYYAALTGQGTFPPVRCNAPWVSAVLQADGAVKPCFFHKTLGNIHQNTLPEILNGQAAIAFRRQLDPEQDSICRKCVCSLYLAPFAEV